MEKTLSYLAGIVTGALVGATIVVLFTPASGETIRSDLRNRFDRLRMQMQDAADDRRAELEGQLAHLREPRTG
ncbi:MAG TPA: YtxH domain-containing protein [Anaerolineales bacterium]|nr:YtxH domain-containing protein [Anaerolineales bacterium]